MCCSQDNKMCVCCSQDNKVCVCAVVKTISSVQMFPCMSVHVQKEDSMRKIRELGSLPTDAFKKYMSLTLSQVCAACWSTPTLTSSELMNM